VQGAFPRICPYDCATGANAAHLSKLIRKIAINSWNKCQFTLSRVRAYSVNVVVAVPWNGKRANFGTPQSQTADSAPAAATWEVT